ncbi:hypothetical protein H4R18_002789 [Coemansia javaensis]|uniref:Thioredoxin domain-containing protein n=1 Tax=Coemansia javaensis TaxID=2761396 RepID=A0A9W8LI78_9FUNG|nr:hypothetical protein H4R18_002789 [Coemansia javaensis]
MPFRDVIGLPLRTCWAVGGEQRETLFWPCASGQARTVLLMIPGSPGVADFYIDFCTAIHGQLGGEMDVVCVSHLGHTRFSDNRGRVCGGRVLGLAEQIDNMVLVFDEVDRSYRGLPAPPPRMVLCAHSVGCYFAQKIVERRASRVDRVLGLFPAIDSLATTPRGRQLGPLFWPGVRHVAAAAVDVLRALLPRAALCALAGISDSLDADNAGLVVDKLLFGSCVGSVLRMAGDEMHMIRDLDADLYRKHGHKFVFYYAPRDGWVPIDRYHRMRKIATEARVVLCEGGIPHAFVTAHSAQMAEIVAEAMRGLGGLLLGAVLAAALGGAGAAPLDAKTQVLNEANFAAKTATGTWVVKYYSPRCKHCKRFQPKWEKVVAERADGLAARGVFFGEVDCRANVDLCEKNNAEEWPGVVAYRGTTQLDKMVGDVAIEELAKFVERAVKDAAPAARKYADSSVVLDAGNYTQHAHKGVWLVKHYSPTCPHCRAMAPAWAKLAGELAESMERDGIHFGEVNCLQNRKLCEENLVDGYPTVNLFVDGKFVEEMLLKYEYQTMRDYMVKMQKRVRAGELAPAGEPVVANDNRDWDDQAADPAPQKASPPPADKPAAAAADKPAKEEPAKEEEEEEPEKPRKQYNTAGEVTVLTPANFAEQTAEGPWFIKFFAPWCPHCQQLAPVWVDLAAAAKGRINIGAVNCDEAVKLCADHKVVGYPTLKLLWGNETALFKGSRDLDNMMDFIDSNLAQPRVLRTAEDLALMRNSTEVAFVFAYDRADTRAGTKAALARVKEDMHRMFLSRHLGIAGDPAVARSVLPDAKAPLPALVALKDGRAVAYPGSLSSSDQIHEWLYAERFPLLPEFTRENADSLFYDSDYLVLAIVDAAKGPGHADTYRENARAAAIEYQRQRDSPAAAGARGSDASVRFAWVNGDKWEAYVDRVFRVRRASLPAVVIVQSAEDRFFTTDPSGAPISPTRMGVLLAVRAAVAGKLRAQSSGSIIVRAARAVSAVAHAAAAFFFGSALRTLLTLAAAAAAVLGLVKRSRGRPRGASFGLVKSD